MLERNGAIVEENHYASIDNISAQAYVVPEPPSEASSGSLQVSGPCHHRQQTGVALHNGDSLSEVRTGPTDASCDDHDGPEDYVEMGSSGSVRDSICQPASQNTV